MRHPLAALQRVDAAPRCDSLRRVATRCVALRLAARLRRVVVPINVSDPLTITSLSIARVWPTHRSLHLAFLWPPPFLYVVVRRLVEWGDGAAKEWA